MTQYLWMAETATGHVLPHCELSVNHHTEVTDYCFNDNVSVIRVDTAGMWWYIVEIKLLFRTAYCLE